MIRTQGVRLKGEVEALSVVIIHLIIYFCSYESLGVVGDEGTWFD